jgi:hypothetical protein
MGGEVLVHAGQGAGGEGGEAHGLIVRHSQGCWL